MSTTATSITEQTHVQPAISRQGWLWLAALAGLFIVLHWHYIWRMGRIATGEWGGDWSHALVVPLISVYFIYQHRDELADAPKRVCWPGLAILFVGLFSFAFWIYPGRNDMFQGYSMIVSLFGLALFLLGPAAMRLLWLPIVYLAFAVKVADRLWQHVAFVLQTIAAKASAVALKFFSLFFSFEASRRGTTIDLTFAHKGGWATEGINVAEACSGLRMLMAFVALGVAMAFLSDRRWWQRLVMVAMAVPIAVIVNVGRVTALGLLFLVNKDMARGDTHTFVGMLMLIPAACLFWLLGWVMDRVVIYDDEPADADADAVAGAMTRAVRRGGGAVTFDTRAIVRGLAVGTAVAALVGVNYGLLLSALRPDLLGPEVGHGMAGGLLAGGVVLMGLAVVFGRRLLVTDAGKAKPAAAARSRQSVGLGVAVGVLLAAVLGLNGVVQATRTVLIKQPIDPRRPLYQVPKTVGTWTLMHEDPPLSGEQLHALGTHRYFSRVYQDASWPPGTPGSEVRLHLTYYTGTPDTVPHVPERCYTAAGLVGRGMATTTLHLQGPGYQRSPEGWTAASTLSKEPVHMPAVQFPGTMFTFAEPGRPDQVHRVTYFFAANGKFLPTADHVRAIGFDPRDRYSYYCKIEVMVGQVSDAKLATQRTSAFLSAVMPEIMACLPDWPQVKASQRSAQVAPPRDR